MPSVADALRAFAPEYLKRFGDKVPAQTPQGAENSHALPNRRTRQRGLRMQFVRPATLGRAFVREPTLCVVSVS